MYPTEKYFARILNKQKRKWLYEPRRFKLTNTTYTPDFYLPEKDLYIEVIGTPCTYSRNKKKIAELKQIYPSIKIIVLRYKGTPYPSQKIHSLRPKTYVNISPVFYDENITKVINFYEAHRYTHAEVYLKGIELLGQEEKKRK